MSRAPRRGGPALRAVARLARRSILRSLGSSALVALLVALPVAGLVGAAVFWESHRPAPEQAAALELGRAQSWVEPTVPGIRQMVDSPRSLIAQVQPSVTAARPTSPPALAPADAVPLPVWDTSAEVRTPSGRGEIRTTVGDVWDPALTGRYLLLSGEPPASADEAMVSPGLLDRLDARVGDTVTLLDSDATLTITGTLRRADQRPTEEVLYLPADTRELRYGQAARWYFADWQPTYAQLEELNAQGYVSYARDLVLDPPPGAPRSAGDATAVWNILMVGTIAAVFSGYLVVLLSGAALMVGARRQQRALAVAASVGASRGDLFRAVVLQGAFLGMLGAALGVAVGLGGAAAALALTDRGAVDTFWGNWGFRVPPALVAAIALFAVVLGTLAALAPARSATRDDALGALRGARRPVRLRVRRPIWGLALLLGGAGLAIAGGAMIAALGPPSGQEPLSLLRVAAVWSLALGPIAFQVGIILAGHWIFTMLSALTGRLGRSGRLAGRDAAANPSRVVPAFAAIAATVFAGSFVLSVIGLTAGMAARSYHYASPVGSVVVHLAPQTAAAEATLLGSARDIVASADPAPFATALVSVPRAAPIDPGTGAPIDPDTAEFHVVRYPPPECPSCTIRKLDGYLTIIAADDIKTALGVSLDAAAHTAYADGAALVLSDNVARDGQITVTQWRAGDLSKSAHATAEPDPVREIALPAIEVDQRMPWDIVIDPATAERLGIPVAPGALVARYAALPAQDQIDRMTAAADVARVDPSGPDEMYVSTERGPSTLDLWLAAILAVAAALVAGASIVSLGLSRYERRPDDATLAAVGGDRRLRRGINAWQGLLVAGTGTIIGTAAGLTPVWGFVQSGQDYDLRELPWIWLVGLAIALPAVIAGVSWLVPPRRPDITRRTAIA